MRSLTTDLALLGFDRTKGVMHGFAKGALQHGFGATLVLDLVAAGHAELGVQHEVVAIGSAPDDALLGEAWRSIEGMGKVRHLRDWVARPLLLVKGLPVSVYEHLAAIGVLEHDGTTSIIHRDRFREADDATERDLVATLAAALDGDGPVAGDDVLLLAIVKVARLAPSVFPDRDHHETDRRIDALVAADADAADVATGVARSVAGDVAAAVAAGVAAGAP